MTLTRAVFTGVMGRDTTLPSVKESNEKWNQTIDNIRIFYQKGGQRINNGWGYTRFEDGKYSGVRRIKYRRKCDDEEDRKDNFK